MDFFYDGQIRRYLLQFMRIFSDIKIRNGPDQNGLYTLTRVPIVYGDPSWVVANLIKGASENTLMPAPMFSAYIDTIEMNHDRRQDSKFVGKVSTVERKFNPETQQYEEGPGIRYDVERYMPTPYDVYFKLDCWTTSMTHKLQIFEQIAPSINHSVQLQQNDNLLDWTSIFSVWMDSFTWTNRSIPQGGDVERDIMTWRFKVHAWINLPAKVKKSNLIAEIVTNVFDTTDVQKIETTIDGNYDAFRSCISQIPTQIVTTEGNYKIQVSRNGTHDEITLLNRDGSATPMLNWENLIQMYGEIVPNITKIRLKLDPNIDVSTSDVIGNIIQDPLRQNVLIFTPDIDTLPANTLPPINEIIDPMEVTPGNGLPPASAGQRYLLTSADSTGSEPAIPPGVPTSPWGPTLVAYPNDIIEFNGVYWHVIFDSRNAAGMNFVVNNSDSTQYSFDGSTWSYSYYGIYSPGYWVLDNIVSAPDGTTVNVYD